MSRFKIKHITRYAYDEPVRDSANQIMLYPIKDEWQEIVNHSISISGNPSIALFTDYFGNTVGSFMHPNPHIELTIDSQLEVRTHKRNFPADNMPQEDQWSLLNKIKNQLDFIDFTKPEHISVMSEISEIIKTENAEENTPLMAAKHFCAYVYKNFKYQKGVTTVESTPDEIWKMKSGVCQDFAHMLLLFLRHMVIPSRYVSGYICPNKTGMRGEGATHAWVEAYIPNMGWVGLDPTNNCLVDDTHVRLAVGKSFADCSPVKGTYRGSAEHTLEVTVAVQYEDGHATRNMNEVFSTPVIEPVKSFSRNTFRKQQEMQQQQQQ